MAGWLSRTDMSHERTCDLTLAVGEMLGNAIEHGGGSGTVRLSLVGRSVTCLISDEGPGLPDRVDRHHAPRPDAAAVDGRGLWLAFSVCTAVRLISSMHGTRVELMMEIPLTENGHSPTA
ncbi:ATP-binding protein [Actinoplanes sp. CA-051413]|uniref:ATP-binding protein n=1 Tax=Actinoplanes sp. CA-051413 TaxID=3239899 RepID=UPI003D964BBE